MKKILAILLTAALLLDFIVPLCYAIDVSAESAVIYDTLTGEFLYDKNGDKKRLIASTTKIMTALAVIENCDLDEVITVKYEDIQVEGSSMYLQIGEKVRVREVLYGLLLMSGNDGGLALANHFGGMNKFVKLMNETAKKIGLSDTEFANPHGLDDENHYSTAKDMARLAAYALNNTTFREIVSTKYYTSKTRSMRNHNKLLWLLDGAIGVKTGFTKSAGRCLVSACERNGLRFVAVTLNAPSDWNDHEQMYEWVFGSVEEHKLCIANTEAFKIRVVSGEKGSSRVMYARDASVKVVSAQRKHIRTVYRAPQFVYAPTIRGATAGYAEFEIHGRIIAMVPLYYESTIPEVIQDETKGIEWLFARLRGFIH